MEAFKSFLYSAEKLWSGQNVKNIMARLKTAKKLSRVTSSLFKSFSFFFFSVFLYIYTVYIIYPGETANLGEHQADIENAKSVIEEKKVKKEWKPA